jgi:uncharacterized protein (DUF2062 family)
VGPPPPAAGLILVREFLRRLHERMGRLAKAHASPGRLAAAAAVGAFVGCTPFYGLHTLIGLGLASLLRLNFPMVFAASQVSMPLVAPFLVFAAVQCGHRLLEGVWLPLAMSELSLDRAKQLAAAWFVGSAVVGTLVAVVAAAGVYVTARARQGRG